MAPVVLVGFGANFVVAYIFPVGEFGSIGAVLSVLFTDTCVIVVVVGGGLTHVEQTLVGGGAEPGGGLTPDGGPLGNEAAVVY